MSLLRLICGQRKCFVRTVDDAGRYLSAGTKVALDNSLVIRISGKCSVRAGYYACPTANTLFHINGDLVGGRLSVQRACKTRINTPRLSAVATLNGKGNLYICLHMQARQRTRALFSECLDYVLGLRVLHSAIDFTKSATDAGLFLNIYSSHVSVPPVVR
jgi:hypothetical protein